MRQRPEDFSYYNAEMTALKTCQTKLKFKSKATRCDAMRRNFKAKTFQIGSVQICISIRTNVQTFFSSCTWGTRAGVHSSETPSPNSIQTQANSRDSRQTGKQTKKKKTEKKRNATLDTKSQNKIRKKKRGKN